MGFGFWGIVKGAFGFVANIFAAVKGSDEKPTLSEILPTVVAAILPAVNTAIEFQGLNTKEKFDAWLGTLDTATGIDAGAVDIIKGMPAQAEEEFFDGLLQAARAFGYNKIGVPGYVETS